MKKRDAAWMIQKIEQRKKDIVLDEVDDDIFDLPGEEESEAVPEDDEYFEKKKGIRASNEIW